MLDWRLWDTHSDLDEVSASAVGGFYPDQPSTRHLFSALMFAKHNDNVRDTSLVREFKPDFVIYEMIGDVLLSQPVFDPEFIAARRNRKHS